MKLFQFLVAALLLASSAIVLAEKPDPNLPNPPLATRDANVDGNDWIRVHEQGTANVHVEGGSIDANITGGTVDANVTNFPSVQDVSIVDEPVDVDAVIFGDVNVKLIPATAAYANTLGLEAQESHDVSFPTINATAIVISTYIQDEVQMSFASPGHTSNLMNLYFESDNTFRSMSFTHPIPINGIHVICRNDSENCAISVSVLGYN